MQLSTHHFVGETGLGRLCLEADCASHSPSEFTAHMTRADLGALVIHRIHTRPYASLRTPRRVRSDGIDLVHVAFVTAGVLQSRQDGRIATAHAGDVTVLRTNAPFQYTVGGAFEAIVLTLARNQLPVATAARISRETARGRRGTFVESTLAFLRVCLDNVVREEGYPSSSEQRAIVSLADAVISEQGEGAPPPSDDVLLRERAQTVIRQSVRSSLLDAGWIAAELGVSRRTLYRSFHTNGNGLSEQIRHLRIQMIADELTQSGPRSSLAVLAQAHGFRSADVCARAFKARYGQSMGAYWLALQPTRGISS